MVAPPSLKEMQQLQQMHKTSESARQQLLAKNKAAARALLLAISTTPQVCNVVEKIHAVNS